MKIISFQKKSKDPGQKELSRRAFSAKQVPLQKIVYLNRDKWNSSSQHKITHQSYNMLRYLLKYKIYKKRSIKKCRQMEGSKREIHWEKVQRPIWWERFNTRKKTVSLTKDQDKIKWIPAKLCKGSFASCKE